MLQRAARRRRSPSASDEARGRLLSAVTFVEGVASGWTRWDLADWLDEHVVGPGYLEDAPRSVFEPSAGVVTVDPSSEALEGVPDLLARARERVVETLRALLHVRGTRLADWAETFGDPATRTTHRLSDIVLGLFAADIRAHPEFYETGLCVCGECGRIAFEPGWGRTGCFDHRLDG